MSQFVMSQPADKPSTPPQNQLPAHGYSAEVLACLVMAENGDVATAEERCKLEIARNQTDGWAHDALGLIYCHAIRLGLASNSKGCLRLALESFARAIEHPTPAPQFYMHLAESWNAAHQPQKALEVMQNAESALGPLRLVKLGLGVFHGKCGHAQAARKIFKELSEEDPTSAVVWENYALAMYSSGDLKSALHAYEGAVRNNPACIATLGFQYAALLAAVGKATDAHIIWEKWCDCSPSVSEKKKRKIDLLERNGQYEAAETLLHQHIQTYGESEEYFFNLAKNLAQQGRWHDAQIFIDHAQRLANKTKAQPHIEALHRAITIYAPRVLELSASTPLPLRDPSKNMIVIRGGVTTYVIDIIKHYRAAHDNVFIILSTWTDTDVVLLSELRPYVDDVLLNHRPETPGMHSLNYQIICAANGVRRAKDLGAERVLVTRTDIAFLRPDLLQYLSGTVDTDQPNQEQTPNLKNRIVICELGTFLYPFYQASDIFCYGAIDDVSNYWSLDHIKDTCLRAEIHLCRSLAAKVGRVLTNSIDDSLSAIQDLFVVRDADSLQLFWAKYPATSSISTAHNKPIVRENVWRGNEELEWGILRQDLPQLTYFAF